MSLEALIEITNRFAAQQSNSVLAVLPDDGQIEYDQKYPEAKLNFAMTGAMAYYHIHSADNRPAEEHGHFHIFLQDAVGQWCHLAALSVDAYGQPLQWFTVNHWVTGEVWAQRQVLLQKLSGLKNDPRLNMVEQWLLALLRFYEEDIARLLEQRDNRLAVLGADHKHRDIMQDRNIYTLSSLDIHLLQDIETALSAG
jgi:hypothetical protein